MEVRKKRADNTDLWADKLPNNTPVVAVIWQDIQYVDNWNTDEEVAPVRNLATIGYLLYQGADPKDPEHSMTVTAATYNFDDGKWADYTVFPTLVVKEIKVLKKPTKKKT